MCVVSMIMDHYNKKWQPITTVPYTPISHEPYFVPKITPAEVAEFKELLERARQYDKDHNQPACSDEDKKQALLKIASVLGIDISFIEENQ